MPLSKRPTKKALSSSKKCPWCMSRSYQKAERLSLLERLRYLGCTVWVCLKCGKKWAA